MPITAEKQPSAINRFFKISERGSTIGREVRGGLATFFAMAYIIVLNPLIIGTATDGTGKFLGGGSSPDIAAVAAATAFIGGLMCILMGVMANFPMAISAGLGLSALITFGIAALPGMTWADAMGLVVIEGVILLILVLTGFREAIFRAVPAQLKVAITVGIGLFIALIGLVNAGFVRSGSGTPVELGVGGWLVGWPTLVFVIGLVTLFVLHTLKVKGAILYAIIGSTILAVILQATLHIGSSTNAAGKVVNDAGWQLSVPELPKSWAQLPDLSLLGQFNLLGSWTDVGVVTSILAVFTMLITNFFDALGTMTAIGAEGDMLDKDKNVIGSRRILVADSIGAIAGGLGSVSNNSGFVESTVGVGEGARTGLANVVTGIGMLLAVFLAPIAAMVPYEAAAPALVLVGFLMMQQVKSIDWTDVEIAIPAFVTIMLMPFAYSITVGIGAGFIMHVVLKVARRKPRDVHPLMWLTAALFIFYFVSGPIKDAFAH
ncbi:NCS2 family permease [Spelaeicoccus albus]|uniref:AGZA family xanthine/uracil permease-like MFS transporter n=1 Tax=Spelaeicoccus albus TaxID=1280376 RepID=A0A7Z0A961_9MICO|nr:NCS2 family permease [Spelaeicoccus albus]NYI65911.1 AGZA family xanthine/uracil permease-like MFS transporter [Spelaeicoccus albus]